MNVVWSIYNAASGIFTGRRIICPEAEVQTNLQPGEAAWRGGVDATRSRVDLGSLLGLVPFKPSAPPDDSDRTWTWSDDVWGWVAEPTLRALKADKWEEIKAARDAEIDAPLATDLGTFDHDAKARQAIVELANGAAVTKMDVLVTLADNSTVKLTPTEMVTVLTLSHTRVQTVRGIAVALREQLDAASSPAEVAAVTWPAAAG